MKRIMPTPESRILIVDDEIDACHSLRDILEDVGYQVEIAQTAAGAMEQVRAHPFKMAILDLKLPDLDGVSLYRQMKNLRSETVAIMVTAYASTEVTRQALQAGISQMLSKPVDVPRLMNVVSRAL